MIKLACLVSVLSLAIFAAIAACSASTEDNVSDLDPKSILPIVPSGVPRGEGELLETNDKFNGKTIVIQVETTNGRITQDYLSESEVVLNTEAIRKKDEFLVFDSIGKAGKRPDGLIYVKINLVNEKRLDWFVLCTRWKPKWASDHGCVLLGQFNGKRYEVELSDVDLSIAENLNSFVIAHL